MGIKNFGTVISKFLEKKHISEFKDSKVGIDGLNWIYRGIYSDFDPDKKMIDKVLNFFTKMIWILKLNNITPIIFLDGKNIKVKDKNHIKRKNFRESFRLKAKDCLDKKDYDSYLKNMNWSTNIDVDLINEFILFLKETKIEFIISPYESDAQMVYLMKEGMIDYIISEDYDLIIYGGNKIIYKLNTFGTLNFFDFEIEKKKLEDENFVNNKSNSNYINFLKLNNDLLVYSLILAGCDYLENIGNFGIKKSLKICNEFNSIEEIINYLKLNKDKYKIPENYFENLKNTYYCFTKQIVYNFEEKELVYFDNSSDKAIENLNMKNWNFYIGDFFENAENFINGNLDPFYLKPRNFPEKNENFIKNINLLNSINLRNYIEDKWNKGKNEIDYNKKIEKLKLNNNKKNDINSPKPLTKNELDCINKFCKSLKKTKEKKNKKTNTVKDQVLNNFLKTDNNEQDYKEFDELFDLDKKDEKIINNKTKKIKKNDKEKFKKITKISDLKVN